MCAKVMEHLF